MFILIYVASSLYFDKYVAFIVTVIYSMYPWFSLYSSSGLRQGFSLCFMLFSIYFFIYSRWFKFLVSILLSIFFHITSVICVSILLVRKLSFRTILIIYAITLSGSIFGAWEFIVNNILSKLELGARYSIYLSNTIDYSIGFRLDFFIFSIVPLFFYFFVSRRNLSPDENNEISLLMKIYMMLNSFMNIMSFMPYYDRFAAFSWYIWPVVILLICYKKSRALFSVVSGVMLISNIILFRVYNWQWFF